ncbi:DUF3237 domain-containing protein [uncultured Corynebacterium sp.]|uniref:DUF3237 domain-containing protein n=1 Tax=uncultured Corynebacterium sp. TaxID=159447 RepID=UPI0025F083BF|nr:DUF3237 domain-containing protein [uncultured Corynebacterium sp.]
MNDPAFPASSPVVSPGADPQFTYAFEIRAEVAPPIRVGEVDGPGGGDLNVAPITGGTVTGEGITGRVLPVGADWWVCTGPTTRLDARYLLATDDGAVIDVVNRGYFHAGESLMARLEAAGAAGDTDALAAAEGEIYYRSAFTFRTAHPGYRWLTEAQFIGMIRGSGGPEPDAVIIRVHRLN